MSHIAETSVRDHDVRPALAKAQPQLGHKPLLLIIALAALPRLYWMLTEAPVISLDGSEYVRMAENLVQGKGLMGNFEGSATMYTPLFSLLTAGVTLITKNAELAAHLVALSCGIGLIVPIFYIARRMYGVHVAYLSAILAAIHPLLIALSGSIYNENVYLPLLLGGIYFGMRALEFNRIGDYVLLSVCLSLAYLTRPEAFAYPLFFALIVWANLLLRRISARRALGASLLIVGSFLVIASPYIMFLHSRTGQFRLEGKWNINYTIANRILSGMEYDEAAYALAPESGVAGPLLSPSRFAAYTPFPHSILDKVHTLAGMAELNRKTVTESLLDTALGSPLVLFLLPIAWFRSSWSRRRLFHECVLMSIALSILFLWVTSSSAEFRYVFPLVALGVIWVAKGAQELGRWTARLILSLRLLAPGRLRRVAVIVEFILLFLTSALAFRSTQSHLMFRLEQKENLDIKKASLWLKKTSPGPKKITCFATVPTYYAEGTLIGLPYARSDQALRYLEMNKVDFVVLDAQYASKFPEVPDWINSGIPDRRAHRIYEVGSDPGRKIVIYRWDSGNPPSDR